MLEHQQYQRTSPRVIYPVTPRQPDYEILPPSTYVLKEDKNGAFFFEEVENFTLPSKTYGDLTSNTDRIIRTFLDRPAATGVMLAGEKGSGKTLLAKSISIELAKRENIPTILINSPFAGDTFSTLIQNINQPVLFLFDEFEKTYGDRGQEAILTLLDGVYPSKKLFLLTSNDKYRIDSHIDRRGACACPAGRRPR